MEGCRERLNLFACSAVGTLAGVSAVMFDLDDGACPSACFFWRYDGPGQLLLLSH